ncbi:MAG: hypothetical protein ACRDUY_16560 [Nitriliruptorales bacterium]
MRRPSDASDAAVEVARIRLLAGATVGRADGLPPRALRVVELGYDAGAAVVDALDAALDGENDVRRRRRALEVATAQARVVAVGLALLPLVAVPMLGAVLALPLWRFYTSSLGAAVGAVGAGFAGAGVAVAFAMVRRVARQEEPGTPRDEIVDLVATALGAGLPPGAALRATAAVVPDRAVDLRRAALAYELGGGGLPDDLAFADVVLRESARWGAPAVPGLRRLAADLRAGALSRALAGAERLPALLTFPTVLLLLPASLLLVGAPLLAAGLDTVGG